MDGIMMWTKDQERVFVVVAAILECYHQQGE